MKNTVFCLLMGALWLAGLGWPIPQRTEGLRVAIGSAMVTTGDWVIPRLWGEPIFTKPPGFYWSLAAVRYLWPGEELTGFRLVSLVAYFALALVAISFWRKLLDHTDRVGSSVGLTAFLVMPCCLGALGQLPSVEMDLAFSFWVVTFWMMVLLWGTSGGSHPGWTAILAVGVLAGGLAGMAVLFKWTAPSFFLPAWIWYLWRSRHRPLDKALFSALVLILCAGLPLAWFLAVAGKVGWDPILETLYAEAMPHLSPTHHTRSYPFSEWVTYPLQVVGMAMPAALPLVFIAAGSWWSPKLFPKEGVWTTRIGARLNEVRLGFAIMLLGSLFFWTVVPGHRPRHSLPIALGFVIFSLPYWFDAITWGHNALAKTGASARPRLALLAWMVIGGFALVKGMMSVGGNRSRENATRVISQANLVTLLHSDLQKGRGTLPFELGLVKDDGFVYLTGLRAVRLHSQKGWEGPGSYLLGKTQEGQVGGQSGKGLIPLLDQQGDPLYLLQKTLGTQRTAPDNP